MSQIIKNKEEIIKYFEKGSKPKKLWKIGTEHEKFLYDLNTLHPINYNDKNGIRPLFKLLKKKGRLIISTPDFDCSNARRYKQKYRLLK